MRETTIIRIAMLILAVATGARGAENRNVIVVNPGLQALIRDGDPLSAVAPLIRRGSADLRNDLIVEIQDGTIRLQTPLRLDQRDSGTNGFSVVYRAAPGTKPVISGGRIVSGWTPDEGGRWHVQTDLGDLRHFYVNDVRAQRARGSFPEGAERYGNLSAIDSDVGFIVPGTDLSTWRNAENIELGFFNSWSHMIGRVQSISADEQGNTRIRMQQPNFMLICRKEGVQAQTPAYIENALELLDEPGEWYFDKPSQMLYYLPRPGEDMASAKCVVPVLESLLELTGYPNNPVHHIRFEGITFADSTWLDVNHRGLADVQANFAITPTNLFERNGYLVNVHNEYLKSPGCIRLRGAHDITFENCTFTRMGGAGIDLEIATQDNTVRGCEFVDISGSAIQIGDVMGWAHHPSDDLYIVKNNRVEDCRIHRIGVEFEDSVGIFAGYTQQTLIDGNELFDLPYSGISIGWGWGEEDSGGSTYPTPFHYEAPTPARDNRVSNNHIYQVMQKRQDGGGVYTLGNQPGTIIEGNHIHDNVGWPGGIYLDEGSGFIEVTGNRVYNVETPLNFNNKNQDRIDTCNVHDNEITENSDP